MTTEAGTPALNKPVPDRSEAEARIELTLKMARHYLATFDGRAAWSGNPYRDLIVRMIEILEDR